MACKREACGGFQEHSYLVVLVNRVSQTLENQHPDLSIHLALVTHWILELRSLLLHPFEIQLLIDFRHLEYHFLLTAEQFRHKHFTKGSDVRLTYIKVNWFIYELWINTGSWGSASIIGYSLPQCPQSLSSQHMHTRTHMCTCTCTHMHVHTHARAHTCTHSCAQLW
jgi:hypothetical protein